mgnify:CR=1 FL=1
MSLLDPKLLSRLKPAKVLPTKIFEPFMAIQREPIRGADYHFEAQKQLDCYFAGAPMFPSDYKAEKERLLRAEREALQVVYEKMQTTEQDLEQLELEVVDLDDQIRILQRGADEGDAADLAGMERRKLEVTDEISDLKHLINDYKAETQRIRRPLTEYLAPIWRDPVNPVWKHGLNMRYMPTEVADNAFFRAGGENFAYPTDIYNHTFFGTYYQEQIRNPLPVENKDDPINIDGGELIPVALHPDAGNYEVDDVDGMDRLLYCDGECEVEPMDSQFFEEFQHDAAMHKYVQLTDNMYTKLHEFRDDFAHERDNFDHALKSRQDGVATGRKFEGYFQHQRKMLHAYVNVYAQDPEYCVRSASIVKHWMDPSTGIFYKSIGTAKCFSVDERLDATSELGDEALQMIMCFFHVAFETAFLHRAGVILLLVQSDSANPRKGMRSHFLGYGQRGNGKSRVGQVTEEVCTPGLVEVITKTTRRGTLASDRSASALCGSDMWHEAPAAALKDWKKGSEAGDDEVEELKTRASEQRFVIVTAYMVKKEDGVPMRGLSKLKMLAQQQLTWFSNTLNPIKDIRPALLDRFLYWCALTMTPDERTAGAINAGKSHSEKELTSDEPLHVYSDSFKQFVHRWQMLVHFHGVLAYYAPGTLAPNAKAHAVVYDGMNRVLKRRGHPEMGNRQSDRAKKLAEQIMWARITYDMFHTPHALWGPRESGFQLDDLLDKNRSLESMLVISFSDSYKAFSSIMHMDRNDEVSNMLQAICRLFLERSDYNFSSMFGDKIEKSVLGGKRGQSMHANVGLQDEIMNSPADIDLDYVKFAVPKNDRSFQKFCSDVSGKTEGIKLTTTQVHELIEFMCETDTWANVKHHEYDMLFVEDGAVMTPLSEVRRQEKERGFSGMVTNENLDTISKKWRTQYNCPVSVHQRGRFFFPYEMSRNKRPCDVRTTPSFKLTEIHEKGYIGVSLHLLMLTLNKENNIGRKIEDDLLQELADSHTVSRFYGSPGSGMVGINLRAPHVLEVDRCVCVHAFRFCLLVCFPGIDCYFLCLFLITRLWIKCNTGVTVPHAPSPVCAGHLYSERPLQELHVFEPQPC